MLDRSTIHVGDVERAVRAGREIDRAKPVVARGQELAAFIHHARGKGRTHRRQPVPMHEVAGGIAHENIAVVIHRQRVTPINLNAARGAEEARVRIGGGEIVADRIDPRRRVPVFQEVVHHALGHVLHGLGECEVRVALEESRRQHRVLNVYAVHADEAVAPVVEGLPKLSAPVHRLDLKRERIEPRVGADLYGRPVGMRGRSNLPGARQAAGQVDPAIRSERRMRHAQLRRVAGVETGQHHALHIGPAVAVGVFQEKHVGRARDEEAAVPGQQAIWKCQAVREHRPAIQAPVAIGIFEQRDHAGRPAIRRAGGVAAVLHDEQPAGIVPGQRAR